MHMLLQYLACIGRQEQSKGEQTQCSIRPPVGIHVYSMKLCRSLIQTNAMVDSAPCELIVVRLFLFPAMAKYVRAYVYVKDFMTGDKIGSQTAGGGLLPKGFKLVTRNCLGS